MSHQRERKEKNCLNCGTQVVGRFCHVCGQENTEPKESFWHLTTHFFNDITHFDGKFFHSLKYVLFKPGKLPLEYLQGRRASYLNPIRMYVFTSAVFFILFFAAKDFGAVDYNLTINGRTMGEINSMDSVAFADFSNKINDNAGPMTRSEFQHFADSVEKRGFHLTATNYKTKGAYDSAVASGVKKHNWFQRQLIYREIEMNQKYDNNGRKIMSALIYKFSHTLPQLLFVSLPLFALFLKLLYRRRKDIYYVNHAIFAIYQYIFVFLVYIVMLGVGKLQDYTGVGDLDYILLLLNLSVIVYLYIGMLKFYKQGWLKTFFKWLLLNIMSFILIIILFLGFLLFSFYEI